MRHRPARLALALLAALSASAVAASGASASRHQESMFEDPGLITLAPLDEQATNLTYIRSLGAQRVRIGVYWSRIAPADRPDGFDASDPNSAGYNWDYLDRVVRLAYGRGLKVNFDLSGGAPRWAEPRKTPKKYRGVYKPSASKFEDFAEAVGKRYSGHFVPDPAPAKATCTVSRKLCPDKDGALPRVDYWTVWNEPNFLAQLMPQWRKVHGKWYPASPRIYRNLVNAAWDGLRKTGHRHDKFIFGELAPRGTARKNKTAEPKPLIFLPAMYCREARHPKRTLRGKEARRQGCPSNGSHSKFRKQNPALFKMSGISHHPYSPTQPVGKKVKDRNFVVLADLSRFQRTIDQLSGRHRVPVYLTEWGYQTRPPDPYTFASPKKQAAYISQAAYMTWRNGRVHAFSQYLLRDEGPVPGTPKHSPQHWGTWQTGLFFPSMKPWHGKAKPGLDSYRLPLYLPDSKVRHGKRVRIWGLVRPASALGRQRFTLRYHNHKIKRSYKGRTNKLGYFNKRVKLPGRGKGWVQIVWKGPDEGDPSFIDGGKAASDSKKEYHSRRATVRIR